MAGLLPLLLFLVVCLLLMCGYPVAFTLAGTALAFAWIGQLAGSFDPAFLEALPNRLYGIMTNVTLIAVPLFVFMGVMLERSRVAENLLDTMAALFGRLRGGLGYSVTLVGMLLAASTGIVGATVVTMGLLSLPTMLRRGYDPRIAAGTICASGTLGQIIPPSIVLVLLGDVLSSAYQQAQLDMGQFSPDTVSVGDLFAGALIPGLLLVGLYIAYIIGVAFWRPKQAPAIPLEERHASGRDLLLLSLKVLVPPLVLIILVLGSIMAGAATPTEAASVGAVGAVILAIGQRQFNLTILREVMRKTTEVSSMVFLIFIGASLFSLVFRGFGGDDMVRELLSSLPGGVFGAMLVVMLVMFLLGFILDFIEITFVVVPIVAPILLTLGLDPVFAAPEAVMLDSGPAKLLIEKSDPEDAEECALVGRFTGLSFTVENAERSAAERRRLESLARAGAGLAHQLRTPIATVKGSCQLLLEDCRPAQEKRLGTVLEETERHRRSLERRIRTSKIGRFKAMADFDFDWPEKIDREQIDDLFSLAWVEQPANVILVGPNGIGKTMIAKNLTHQAVLHGASALFITASELLNDLAARDSASALQRRLRHYCRPQVLAIDEVGYLSYDNRHADLLFEIVTRRYAHKPIIITTNKAFTDWSEVFPNASCTVTLIDRLVHYADIAEIKGKSYRLKEAKQEAARKAKQRAARRIENKS